MKGFQQIELVTAHGKIFNNHQVSINEESDIVYYVISEENLKKATVIGNYKSICIGLNYIFYQHTDENEAMNIAQRWAKAFGGEPSLDNERTVYKFNGQTFVLDAEHEIVEGGKIIKI